MPKSLTIFQKGLLLIAIPVILQIAFLIYLSFEQRHSREEQEQSFQNKNALAAADRLERGLIDAHGAIRFHAFTPGQRFLDLYHDELNKLPSELETLRTMAKTPAQRTHIDRAEKQITALKVWMSKMELAAQAGNFTAALAQVQDPSGLQSLAIIRQELDDYRGSERSEDMSHTMAMRSTSRRITWVLSIGLGLALLTAVPSVGIFARHITGRLARLSENVDLFLRGKTLPAPMKGSDEISRMDHIFQAMASSISASAKKETEYKISLEKRAGDLTRANEELSQKSDEIEMFVYSVSHDLRSPLVNLQGFSKELSLVTEDLRVLLQEDGVPAKVRETAEGLIRTDMAESLHFIQSGVTRLANIIDALLRLSRAGRVEYAPKDVSIEVIARSVSAALESTRDLKKATITIGPMPDAHFDPAAAEQVFANCVGNALNYLDPERPGRIEVGALPIGEGDASVTYFVKDNGLGIPAAYLPKVFVVFQRLHGNAAPGEGIGLALVRRVLERNGGAIWVESEEGVGTTFFIRMPATQQKLADLADAREPTLSSE